ncbi:MAG: energy transducer TonB, partial [Alistipes sp.]|nr:energy transducer TonB [Alistipes sp.]
MRAPLQEEESGIPVMMGNTDLAKGHTESYQFTEVTSIKSHVPNTQNAPQTQPKPQAEEPVIT